MKKIGIRLADGSFYPIMEDGSPSSKKLGLTTVKDNQTKIIVDLYRSKSGTMEDAEYIDSLQIDNLVAHPNGSMDIPLHIELDENNKLSAYIEDPETGARSDANITLVSRTLEERLEPTNYDVRLDSGTYSGAQKDAENENGSLDSDFEQENKNEDETAEKNPGAAAAGIAAGGLLARMIAKRNESEQETIETSKEENTAEESDFSDNDFPATEESGFSENDFEPAKMQEESDISGLSADEIDESGDRLNNPEEFEENRIPETADADEIDESASSDDSFGDSLDFDFPDFSDSSEQKTSGRQEFSATEDSSENSGETLDFPETEEFPEVSDETVFDETPDENLSGGKQDENSTDKTTAEDDSDTFSIPETENSLDEFELPEIEEDTAENDILDFDLPNFSDEPDESNEKENNEMKNEIDDDFFSSSEDGTRNSSSQFDSAEHTEVAAGGIAFDDLYDKETKDGKSYKQSDSAEDGDEIEKKTKTPVIICIICAIICVIAVLILLFVVPSKYNLLGKRKAEANVQQEENVYELPQEEIAEEENIPEPEPEIEAKEDDIVVITEPEIVETIEPEPVPEPETPKSITYKIKWGDTLWDIADAYYKNPWRYHTIARYNNIKNPDYIISGTTIEIPQN